MILSGKEISKNIEERLKSEGLLGGKKILLIQASSDNASNAYANNIAKKAEVFNVKSELIKFDETITTESFIEHLQFFNQADYDGIMLFAPFYSHLDFNLIVSNLDVSKDIDCLNSFRNGKFYIESSKVGPATAKSVMEFLMFNKIELESKHVCIVGASNVVGFPLAKLFLNQNATVTVCNKFTKDLSAQTLQADIIISCAGVANLITNEAVKPDQIVLDVGINFVEGKMCGDVSYQEVSQICHVSPVPGGVGAVTSVMIFDNLNELIKEKRL